MLGQTGGEHTAQDRSAVERTDGEKIYCGECEARADKIARGGVRCQRQEQQCGDEVRGCTGCAGDNILAIGGEAGEANIGAEREEGYFGYSDAERACGDEVSRFVQQRGEQCQQRSAVRPLLR